MTAATADRNTPRVDGVEFAYDVDAAKKIYAGTIVALDTADGNRAKPGATATTLIAVGIAQEQADNSAGADAAIKVKVRRGVFRLGNSSAGDAITLADIGADCYIVDDQTVAKTSGSSTRSIAGKVVNVDSDGVWVRF